MKKKLFLCIALVAILAMSLLAGCAQQEKKTNDSDSHLTVYLWQTSLVDSLIPYVREQLPDKDIEFIVGNNNTDLYNYLAEHGDMPDIVTTRRFSAADAQSLQPYLLDLASYDIVSEYYPYALQYYKSEDGQIQWLPVCGIPETTIINKSILDKHGLKVPKNYKEFATLCQKLDELGIKPYVAELANDWADHSLLQGSAIEQFSSLEGIEWRSSEESSQVEPVFDEKLWKKIFKEADTFLKDTKLGKKDIDINLEEARAMFIDGEAAMFRGTPEVIDFLNTQMKDKLVQIPYFPQSGNESYVYTYPSMNVALSNNLSSDQDKLDTAMKILDCFVSEEGQKIIAGGSGTISYSANVDSDLKDMEGIKDEVENNRLYIRYASNNSFPASLTAIQGLASGKMTEEEAFDAFRAQLNNTAEPAKTIEFENDYSIAQNEKGGRDAASSILTTVRDEHKTQLAIAPFYYFTASIYKGACTETQANMLTAMNSTTELYTAKLSGATVKKFVSSYFDGTGRGEIATRYELPIASGMKMDITSSDNGFALKGIEVNGQPISDEETYSILLTQHDAETLKTIDPKSAPKVIEDVSLATSWLSAVKSGEQPAAPEDYIAIED